MSFFNVPGGDGGSRVLNALTDNVRKCSASMRMGFQSGAASVRSKQTQAAQPNTNQIIGKPLQRCRQVLAQLMWTTEREKE